MSQLMQHPFLLALMNTDFCPNPIHSENFLSFGFFFPVTSNTCVVLLRSFLAWPQGGISVFKHITTYCGQNLHHTLGVLVLRHQGTHAQVLVLTALVTGTVPIPSPEASLSTEGLKPCLFRQGWASFVPWDNFLYSSALRLLIWAAEVGQHCLHIVIPGNPWFWFSSSSVVAAGYL